jgi:hypothetical protein
MSYRLIIRPEAELDLEDAFIWYELQETGLGSEFVRSIDIRQFKFLFLRPHMVYGQRQPYFFAVKHSVIFAQLLAAFVC